MNKRIRYEIRDWLGIIGWIVFIILFLYAIIRIKNFDSTF